MPSSWKAALLETLWAQRRYYVAYNQYPRPVAQQFRFALAVPILAQTLQNACWMSRGNVPVFTNLLRRLCVVDKTKAYFMHVVHAEWGPDRQCGHNLYQANLLVFRISLHFWERHVPPDFVASEALFLAYCRIIASVMADVSTAMVDVQVEATPYRLRH